MESQKKHILALDIGSTLIKACVVNENIEIIGKSLTKVEYIYPQPKWVEIDEELLWTQVKTVMKEAVQDAGLDFTDIAGLGISTQRGCCITWDRETGKPFHKIISWMDRRSALSVESWNKSFTVMGLKMGAALMYYLSGCNRRFSLAKAIHLETNHVLMKLEYLLNTIKELRERAEIGMAMFGGIDSWIIWKMTSGKKHITDIGLASSTALFDPFQCDWSSLMRLFNIPMSLCPEIVDTCGNLATADEEIFGVPLKITAITADAQASLFGLGCFKEGDIGCSLGTGAFLNLNTGSYVHTSVAGLYPIVAWKIGDKVTYIAEGFGGCQSAAIEWMKKLGFIEKPEELDKMANSVPDSGGLCFVPAYTGFQIPIYDSAACTCMMGINEETTKDHIVRAVLESFAFRFFQLFKITLEETQVPISPVLRVSGGVSNSDFVVQSMADLTDRIIERPVQTDCVLTGTAVLAGFGAGFWDSTKEAERLFTVGKVFYPNPVGRQKLLQMYETWLKAMNRSLKWHKALE